MKNKKKYTKNQHVIPRGYLKNFLNSHKKLNCFSLKRINHSERKTEKICSHNYAYEASPKFVDNILENHLAKLESKYLPYIDKIVKNYNNGNLRRTDIDYEMCYKFMILMHIRSDSNRILFSRAIFGLDPMQHHLNLTELEKWDFGIKYFNARFKTEKLEAFLDLCYEKEKPVIHMGITKDYHFLTSDNPVITYYFPTKENLVFLLPIAPNICLYFIGFDKRRKYQVEFDQFPEHMSIGQVRAINRGIINVANYWIISKHKFDTFENMYIYKKIIKK